MARNIINPGDIDRLLQNLDTPVEGVLKTWLSRVAKRWILREFEPLGQVIRFERDVYVQGEVVTHFMLPGGGVDELHLKDMPWLDLDQPRRYQVFDIMDESADALRGDLYLALLYLKSLECATLERLCRITPPDAIAAGRVLAERQARQALEGQTLELFDDGYRMVLLENEADLAEEGKSMSHCVTSYAQALEQRQVDLLSLRDPAGRPHVTLEVRGGKVVQVRGRGNSKVAPRYRQNVQNFLAAWDIPVVEEREMLGLTTRSFDAGDHTGWRADTRLAGELQLISSARRCSSVRAEDFERDLTAVIDELDDETWDWVQGLFQDEEGRFVRFIVSERFEVAGEVFAVCELLLPRVLQTAAQASRHVKRREVVREILAQQEGVLLRFLQSDRHNLLMASNLPWDASIDLKGLRWAHMARVRRQLAKARKQARRFSQNQVMPSWLCEKWKCDWRAFADRAHRLEQNFC